MDLTKGYLQVEMDLKSICKTAICTPFGTFEFFHLPFRVCNMTATFQRQVDKVLKDLPFYSIYLDNMLIASTAGGEHLHYLREILTRLRDNILSINPDKCTWPDDSVVYLGHVINDKQDQATVQVC